MPQQIDTAIREMCSDAMSQAVAALSEKYGFDAEEANRFLATDTLKIVRKRGPAASSKTEKPNKADKATKPDKVKRGKTGYLLYADEVRQETKESLIAELEEGTKLKPQEVVKAIAARWKAEDQDVRDEWNAKAKTPATSDEEPGSLPTSDDELMAEPVVAEPVVAEVTKPKTKKEKEKKKKKTLEDDE